MDRITIDYNCGECPIHQGKLLTYVCTDPNKNKGLKCSSCNVKDKASYDYLLSIPEILESNEETIFPNWPIQNDMELMDEIVNISTKQPTDEMLNLEINTYIKQLRMSLNDVIDEIQEEMLIKTTNIWDLNKDILDKYHKMSCKFQMKSILTNKSLSFDQKNNQLNDIIQKIIQNQIQYKETIKESINNLKFQESAFDFQTPKLIQSQVMSLLKKINFVLVDNIEDLAIQIPNVNGQADEDPVKVILDLVKNKFNRCSPSFVGRLETHLKKSFALKNFIVGEVRDCQVPSLESLNEQDVEDILDVTRFIISKKNGDGNVRVNQVNQVDVLMNLVSNRFNYCSNQYLQTLDAHLQGLKSIFNRMETLPVRENNIDNPDLSKLDDLDFKEITKIASKMIANKQLRVDFRRRPIKTDDIIRLVGNKTNFCNEQFLNQLHQILSGVSRYVSSFQISPIHYNGNQQMSCDTLSNSQITNLSLLAYKMSELSSRYGSDYTNSQSPQPNMQCSSNMISNCLQQNLLVSQKNQTLLAQLLVTYPIFENVNLRPIQKKYAMKFIKTNRNNSKNLQIISNDNSSIIYQPFSLEGTVVSELPLENNLAYIICCSFNRPYDSHDIRIGLVESSQIHTSWPNSSGHQGFQSQFESGKICMKGSNLASASLRGTIKRLEFRICIETQQFYFTDFPQYNHINYVNPPSFDINESYHFGIGFGSPGDNWSVTIDDVSIMEDRNLLTTFE